MTSESLTLKLPNELLETILENCVQFNCLLVNRRWSQATVRILWSDPFLSLQPKIVDVYLKFLNTTEREELNNNGIQLWEDKNFTGNNNKPAFYDYPKFLKHISTETFLFTLNEWLETFDKLIKNSNLESMRVHALILVLVKMFRRLAKPLNSLGSFCPSLEWFFDQHDFLYWIMTVKRLRLEPRNGDIFPAMSRVCHHIESLYLNLRDFHPGNIQEGLPQLKKLLSFLTNLQHLTYFRVEFRVEQFPEMILPILNTLPNSLLHLVLKNIMFLEDDGIVLTRFHMLKSLEIYHAHGLSEKTLDLLMMDKELGKILIDGMVPRSRVK
ncbi:hypothetical protein G9A89_016919 [Geosiphon pyriformis]|nr:hypothetical protein G9A89_016919 [Geosiphon pyriformis]